MAKILKNQTGSPIALSDVGITVPASPSTYTIPAQDYLLWAGNLPYSAEPRHPRAISENQTITIGKPNYAGQLGRAKPVSGH